MTFADCRRHGGGSRACMQDVDAASLPCPVLQLVEPTANHHNDDDADSQQSIQVNLGGIQEVIYRCFKYLWQEGARWCPSGWCQAIPFPISTDDHPLHCVFGSLDLQTRNNPPCNMLFLWTATDVSDHTLSGSVSARMKWGTSLQAAKGAGWISSGQSPQPKLEPCQHAWLKPSPPTLAKHPRRSLEMARDRQQWLITKSCYFSKPICVTSLSWVWQE